ncbi:hypothetical protein D3875_04555 [Deinococcus cavernae]|uniref:Uncharacterized protein n=1 Tax=Deinococcus cavernae TaxID=2320857 RepID=A0A418V9I7_9DEIO|nr:hypothetical protein [Deinococcus cavernae]RJF72750.1 hypothetical protein D3875_15575 [Deinococcus cavernae]RJF74230.1 hypothetical protein D3875_04555 [Deinococcus cavernae]
MTYDSYSYDADGWFGDDESCGRNDPYHPEYEDYNESFDDSFDTDASAVTALRRSTYDYGLEDCLGSQGVHLGTLQTHGVVERLENRARGAVLRDAHIPSTLEEVEVMLGIHGEDVVRTPAAAAHLVDRLMTLHDYMGQRVQAHPKLKDHPAGQAIRRIPMHDLTAISAGLKRVYRTYITNKTSQIRNRLMRLRAALTVLLNAFRQQELLASLLRFLLPDEPEDATPRPIYARPRPPSAPLAPPV